MACRVKRMLLLVSIGWIVATAPRAGLCLESGSGMGPEIGRAALMAVDVFPVRFGSFLRMTVGGVMLVPVTIFSTLSYPFERNPEIFQENADVFVVEPFIYTFRRPLGEDFGGL